MDAEGDAVCLECGQVTDADKDFCSNPECKAFLKWQRQDRFAPKKPAQQAAASAGPRIVKVGATTTTPVVAVQPGDAATVRLTVTNLGTVVDEYRTEVAGEAMGWARSEPESIKLMPGTTGTVDVHLAPPREPEPRAGRLVTSLHVRSSLDEQAHADVALDVDVAPFQELRAALEPAVVTAQTDGRFILMVDNRGNAPEHLTVKLTDSSGDLALAADPATFTCEPGARVPVQIHARAGATSEPARLAFRVALDRDGDPDGPAAQQTSTLQVRPPAKSKVPWIVAGGLAALLAGGGLFSLFGNADPGDDATAAPTTASTSAPTTTVAPTSDRPGGVTQPPTTDPPTDPPTDPAPTTEPPTEPPDPPFSGPDEILEVPHQGDPVTVEAIRTGVRLDHERIAFDIEGDGTPGWRVEWVDEPLQVGSGDPIDLPGGAWLRVILQGIQAPPPILTPGPLPTEAGGQPTDFAVEAPDTISTGDLVVVESIHDDRWFEGQQTFFIGTDQRRPFRVFIPEDLPDVLVVDINTG